MQAIILAAGMGRRLGNLTKNNTKCMIKVNKVTLIERMLKQLDELNLNKIILVVGYKATQLIEYVSKLDNITPIEYIENPIYGKTNNIYSLALAKEKLQEDDSLLLESDLIFESSILNKIIEDSRPNLALVSKYETWMDGTMVKLDEDDNILNFVHKKAFDYKEIDSYYKTVNIYKFSKKFSESVYVPFLEAYMISFGFNEYYEQVLRIITSLDKSTIKSLVLGDERWYEIDDMQDLDIAEAVFSHNELKLKKYQNRYGGYWRFPKLIDFCYLVNPYFPSKRMVEELKANFEVLLREYPSGMNIISLLASKYYSIDKQYVCVGNGAAELIKSLMEQLDGNLGIVYPTFEEYPNRQTTKKLVKYHPKNNDFSYTADDLINFYSKKNIDVLLLINPDNPSGNFIEKEDVMRLINWTKDKKIKLVLDESFVDFSTLSIRNSLLSDDILEKNTHLIIIKSISKSYGVPGLRLGVLASSDNNLISSLKKNVAIWNINSFAEYYLQIFNKYEYDYHKACQSFIKERSAFLEKLKTISFLRVIPSQANYFLCEVIDKYTSTELAKLLLDDYSILIKDCAGKSGFDGRNYIRLAIRDENDNNKLIEALNNIK